MAHSSHMIQPLTALESLNTDGQQLEIPEPAVKCLKLAEMRTTAGWTRSGLTFRIYDATEVERPDGAIAEIERGSRPVYSALRDEIVRTFKFFIDPLLTEDDIFPERAAELDKIKQATGVNDGSL